MSTETWPEWNGAIEKRRNMTKVPPLPPHPEHHSMTWSSLERRAILEYARQVAEQVAEPLLARIALLEAQLASVQEPVGEREAFEVWAESESFEVKALLKDGRYWSGYTQRAWEAWQARAAHPAQQPLSNEQIRDVLEDCDFTYNPTLFARAIEVAHGIKEKP
jgi:hypothetical protein